MFEDYEPELLAGYEPVTEADIRALEAELGTRLPDTWRRVLLDWGGAELMSEPSVPLPRAFRGDLTARVAGLLGKEDGVLLEEREDVDDGLLPIARDPGDDLFCLRLADGAVVLIAHDEADEAVVVAADVDAFVAALTPRR